MQRALQIHQANPTTTKWSSSNNFQTASEKGNYTSYKIVTTHNYYKFTPTDSSHIDILLQDTVLLVSDIPFEYEIKTNGAKYVDPDFPIDGAFTYYYSVAPVDYKLPAGIPVETIAELHFTDEDSIPGNPTPQQVNDLRFLEELNEIALFISGYMEQEDIAALQFIDNNNQQTQLSYSQYQENYNFLDHIQIDFQYFNYLFGRKWRPEGRVTVEEGVLTQNTGTAFKIGVKGAEVRVRKWGFLVIRRGITDENGYFRTKKTSTKRVKYSCYFNNDSNFTIKAGSYFWNARHWDHKTYKRRVWYQYFPESIGRSHFYSLIQNASYDYFHHIPKQYGLWPPSKRTNVNAEFEACKSSQTRPRVLPFHCQIRITRQMGKCIYRRSDGIYASTIHEWTHQAHIREDVGLFVKRYKGYALNYLLGLHYPFKFQDPDAMLMTESWAEGVETIITNDRYRGLYNDYRAGLTDISEHYPLWNDVSQADIVSDMDEYTPIVADLIDDLNQNFTDRDGDGIDDFSFNQPIDRVSGYRLVHLQLCIEKARTIDDWRDNIKNRIFNPTEYYLYELFEYPNEVADNL